jgi:hypothetical protein
MGGWASYLLPIEHPDWFAAAYPASGPVTQGAYTGVDFSGCDSFQMGGTGLCFTGANGGDPRAEYTYPLLDNLKWVPYAIYQGTNDELVPTTGVTLNVKRLQDLGYRYRYYLFPGQEHYGPPIVDQWVAGADYEHQFTRDPNPPEVTYIRSMVFEHAINAVNSGGVQFNFNLDHAYWMSALTPVDPAHGLAKFDGRSLAIRDPSRTTLAETGAPVGPEQSYPYAMAGQRWLLGHGSRTSNGFAATLTGASAVTLHTVRMGLRDSRPVTGRVSTDSGLALTLNGNWPSSLGVQIDGSAVAVQRSPGAIELTLPAGQHTVSIGPG